MNSMRGDWLSQTARVRSALEYIALNGAISAVRYTAAIIDTAIASLLYAAAKQGRH